MVFSVNSGYTHFLKFRKTGKLMFSLLESQLPVYEVRKSKGASINYVRWTGEGVFDFVTKCDMGGGGFGKM